MGIQLHTKYIHDDNDYNNTTICKAPQQQQSLPQRRKTRYALHIAVPYGQD